MKLTSAFNGKKDFTDPLIGIFEGKAKIQF
jgi:hypothetical protein